MSSPGGPVPFEFDAALSFAGPDREVAGVIARVARENGLRVFFDEDYAVRVWGRDLVEELSEVYTAKARYCLVLVSQDYLESAYTRVERRAALDRAIRDRAEYILPVVLDDAWIPGLPRSTAYLDLRRTTAEEVAVALVRKVRGDEGAVSTDTALIAKVRPGAAPEAVAPGGSGRAIPLRFALVRLAAECEGWTEAPGPPDDAVRPRTFSGQLGPDPTFDITLLHDAEEPLLLDRVGIQFTRAGYRIMLLGGGSGLSDVKRRDTFVLALPDLWARMREVPSRVTAGGHSAGPIAVDERAESRLPDPLLLEGRAAYRFALVLFDYSMLIPSQASLRFFVHTDRGAVYSEEVGLGYTLGGNYGGYARVFGPPATGGWSNIRNEAERLWKAAGRPVGQDLDFWLQAEEKLRLAGLQYVSLRPRPL